MTDKILALMAFLVLAGFLGILVRFVPRVDLIVVVVLCLILAGADFYLATFRRKKKQPAPENHG
jgi:uncharacterized membrane protein YfcA